MISSISKLGALQSKTPAEDKCYATRIGYPGYWMGKPDKAIINLGPERELGVGYGLGLSG